MNIGEKIKYHRKNKGFTQKELAEKSNISRSYLADVENNRYNPSIDVVKSIANALGVSVDEFFREDSDSETLKENDAKNKGVDTIAAHLEGKNLTPEKIKEITKYIDFLFHDEDD